MITLKLVYWVVVIIWLVLKIVSSLDQSAKPDNHVVLYGQRLMASLLTFEFILFIILGLKVFGSP